MSEFDVKKITNRAGTGAPNFTYGLNIAGSDSGLIGKAFTSSGTQPASPANGDLWYDSDNDKLYYYVNSEFKQITHENANTQNAWSGTRGIFGGGEASNNGSSVNTINQIDITTPANATDFGDLSVTREYTSALSNQTRGVFGGGGANSSTSYQDVIDYVTISTAGNATDFGDLTQAKSDTAACSNGTVGVFAMGFGSGSGEARYKTDMDKITVATTGNATDFGDLIRGNRLGAAYGDLTRGIICGGYNYYSANDETIQYITYASPSNATDFGDMTVGGYTNAGCSDATRGVMAGGSGASFSYQNVIDYITIQTTGNATDFGDLSVGRETVGTADSTYAVFNSGGASGSWTNTMDYVTIQTTGNATDFGDNTSTINGAGGCSGSPS